MTKKVQGKVRKGSIKRRRDAHDDGVSCLQVQAHTSSTDAEQEQPGCARACKSNGHPITSTMSSAQGTFKEDGLCCTQRTFHIS